MSIRPLFLLGSLLAAGCYMAPSDSNVTAVETDGSALSNSEGGASNVGDISDGRGILYVDGFKLYWRQYSAWDEGACVDLRLKNESGDDVQGWGLDLELSDELTAWYDEGGAFFFPTGDEVYLEADGNDELDAWDSATMYFCAEPAVDVDAFRVNWRGGSTDTSTGDDDDGDDSTVDNPGFSGALESEDGVLDVVYSGVETSTQSCVEMLLRNASGETVGLSAVDFELSGSTEVLATYGGTAVGSPAAVLSLSFSGVVLEPGEGHNVEVCMDPLREPEEVLNVTLSE